MFQHGLEIIHLDQDVSRYSNWYKCKIQSIFESSVDKVIITLFVGVGGISQNCETSLGFILGFLKIKNLFNYQGLLSRMFRPVLSSIMLSAGVMVILTSSISANFCFMMSYRVCYFAILLLYLHQCSHSLRGLLFWYLCYFAFKSSVQLYSYKGVCYFCC